MQYLKILEYFIRSIKKGFTIQKCPTSEKYVNLICTQYLVEALLAQINFGLDKTQHGATPTDHMAPQIITDCGNVTLDFKQLGFCASPFFLQTPGP